MKITRVEILTMNLEEATNWHPVIVRLHTDEGLTGVGEVGIAIGSGTAHSAGAGMAKNLAEQFVLGVDPFKTEMLWEEMFRSSFWGLGGGPVVYSGMSGIDTAMWDIKGKALGVPVYQLLGGKTNDNLRTYASQIQFGWSEARETLTTPEQYADAARIAVAQGFDCVKIDPVILDREGNRGKTNLRRLLPPALLSEFRDRIAAVRDAVGPEVDVILELHSLLSVANAIKLAEIWEEFNCLFYEEPVHYNNPALHTMVAKNVKIPTAAGERIYTRWGYRPYFEQQAISVIQPDLGLVGGISEGKKICDYANTYDITVQVHTCSSPVSMAAALQLEATIPNFMIHEHHTNAIKPYSIIICNENYQPVNGRFAVPDLPGLGVTLNEDIVAKADRIVVE